MNLNSKKDINLPSHNHPYEQTGYLVSGKLNFRIENKWHLPKQETAGVSRKMWNMKLIFWKILWYWNCFHPFVPTTFLENERFVKKTTNFLKEYTNFAARLRKAILMQVLEFDTVIIGSGLAGLTAAYYSSQFGSVAIVTKSQLDTSNSYYAQGGIAAAITDEDSPEQHITGYPHCRPRTL